jgi:hypothetical protein
LDHRIRCICKVTARELGRNINLVVLLPGKENAHPLAEHPGTTADVYDDIQDLAFNCMAELFLTAAELVMQWRGTPLW